MQQQVYTGHNDRPLIGCTCNLHLTYAHFVGVFRSSRAKWEIGRQGEQEHGARSTMRPAWNNLNIYIYIYIYTCRDVYIVYIYIYIYIERERETYVWRERERERDR